MAGSGQLSGPVVTSKELGFTVTMPNGAPTPRALVSQIAGSTLKMTTYSCTVGNKMYTVRVADALPQFRGRDAKVNLQRCKDSFVEEKRATVSSLRYFQLGAFPAISFRYVAPRSGFTLYGELHIVVAHNRIYNVDHQVLKQAELELPEAARFFKSFALI